MPDVPYALALPACTAERFDVFTGRNEVTHSDAIVLLLDAADEAAKLRRMLNAYGFTDDNINMQLSLMRMRLPAHA
jgi:hypothetical protein